MMATVQPSNNSELQLYRVLQRANLLQYFETFITQGGDDVQQLCEAGEDEFLEIMALVGMASKPLHVRRLQKALQEWVANPAAFEIAKKYPTHVMSMTGSASQNMSPTHPMERSGSLQDFKVTPPQSSTISTSTPWSSQSGPRGVSPSEGSNLDDPSSSSSPQGDFKDIMKDVLYNQEDAAYAGMMNMAQPVLLEHQITAIATAAAILAQELPPFEPKTMPKKQMSKEITTVMLMSADDPNRMDALRKYAAIYGRFDSKRKNDRPMSLHEISVNEAAAQLCSHFPALLTRREELFPLARQVVRESGYQYSKGHSRYDYSGAAEVFVQPKLEQGEAMPSTSSVAPMSQETTFHELQSELTQITMDLSEMAKEQDRIRSALRVLLEANDHEQMKALTAEMDDLNDRQAAMTKKRQRIVNSIAKYRKGASKYSVPTVCLAAKSSSKMSPPHGLSSTKPVGSSGKYANSYNFHDDPLPSNPLNTLYMAAMHNQKDSLFEEGLRIATQYGMSDFAQELIGMKSNGEDDPDVKVSGEGGGAAVYNGFPPSSSSHSVAAVSALSPPVVAISTSLGNHTVLGSSSVSSSSSPTANGNVTSKSRPKSASPTTTPSSNKTHHTTSASNVSVADHPSSCATTPSSNTSEVEPMDSATADSSIVDGKSTPSSDKQNTTSTTSSTTESTLAQGSMTTTTTITTKSGQVIEVETRRSSRRKNGEPDYYLINGGEKRFRSSNSRRSSSTSSERARRLSSSSSSSSMTCSTPTSTTPVKQSKPDPHTNGDSIIRMNLTDLRFRNGEVQKVILNVNQSGDRPEGVDTADDIPAEDRVYTSGDSEKRVMRKKGRTPSYTGQKLLIEDYSQ